MGFGSVSFSPPADCQEDDQAGLKKILLMKVNQETNMRAEEEKLKIIENMIEMKKLEKEMQENKQESKNMLVDSQESLGEKILARKERDLAEQDLEITKQRNLLLH